MGTLSSLMDLSREALMADQNALNITANNVSNQNTPGYTREVVNWQPADAVTLSGTSYSIGVSSTAVSVRDRVLEQRVQQQTQTQAQSGALQTALQQVQDIFGLTSTSTSASSTTLGSAVDSFFNSLSSLESNPADTSARQAVLTAANNLTSAFNSASNQLSQVSTGLDQQVGTTVGQINSLTTTIASLNQQIATISPNADAGTLEDQRQLAIAQLSQYVGLDQMTTESNGITLTTANGAILVSGSQSYALSTTQVAGKTDVVANGQDITSGITGGQLGGVLQARDQNLPTYASALDNLAYGIGTAVNQQNALGTDGNGNPGGAIFTLPTSAAGAAGLIQVATSDPKAIAAAATGEGSSGSGNAIALADLSTANVAGGQTASGFLASFLGQVGNDTAGATTNNTAQQATLTQLTSQRDSLSGVSLDEEASNLTQYQRSYEAAAKVFSIVDSIMASALNLGVETTVT
ncbi:flagellar hook-associated protein FlgK [Edaphobacter dinghuensis]|uniref:Flagellar hook-associated protein 1 n=1 Tax=Edaphobacter dinghuensis TaxID=1560005 RepID=A0A917M2W3_9BACT|nr:flagellar hook-associated protein FlgK [Edaphobacter dinghuensis]GGG73822.1 flagellar hook-associated protein 1 [Edaphobacter dinghuensis]